MEIRKVVVIGSGATAATVVPAMASSAKHVTMLQRTPTFFRTGRNAIEIAETLSARPRKATEEYFTGKVIDTEGGVVDITPKMAKQICRYLMSLSYHCVTAIHYHSLL